jgi:hypothetical protein
MSLKRNLNVISARSSQCKGKYSKKFKQNSKIEEKKLKIFNKMAGT